MTSLLLLAAALSGPPASAPDAVYAIRLTGPAATVLRRALDDARERLADPRCEAILDEWPAIDGRSLRERLAEVRVGDAPVTIERYLSVVVWYDGRDRDQCRSGRVAAVTHPGTRLIYVCPSAFTRRAMADAEWGAPTVIHEALHTLGLGENPPTSHEIAARVIEVCGQR